MSIEETWTGKKKGKSRQCPLILYLLSFLTHCWAAHDRLTTLRQTAATDISIKTKAD
jgi:hypothetical protein